MADITKTVQSELKAIANVAASTNDTSSVFDASAGHLSCMVYVDFAPEATNTPGTEIRVEVSQKNSGTDGWVGYTSVITTTAAVNSHAVDGTEAAGATTIEETTTTGLDRNQIIFFKNGTLANSEWAQLVAFTASTSFQILDGLTNAQTGSTWYNRGQRFVFPIDLSAITRLRVVCNNNYGASSVAVNWRVAIVTADAMA